MIKKFISFFIFPLSIFFIFVTFPALILPNDVWDGVLIEYALEIKDYTGLKNWFFESTWFLQYYYVLSLIVLSDLFGVSYKNFNSIITFIIMFALLREILLFSENQVGLNKLSSKLTLMFAASFPAWSTLLSSVLSFHLFCTALGLFGVRAIHDFSITKKIIGAICVFLAFSLQSQLVFLPILSYVYDAFKNRRSCTFLPNPSVETLFAFGSSIFFYLCISLINPQEGIYATYRTFIIGSLAGIFPFILRGFHYLTYLIPVSISIFICLVCALTLREHRSNTFEFSLVYDKYPRYVLIWILILFFSGAFPYMSIGTSSIIWEVNDWWGRQAFLLVLPLSILFSLLFQIIYESCDIKFFKKIIFLISFAVLIINFSLLTIGVFAKHSRQYFLTHLQEIIKLNASQIRPGLLQIVVNGMPPSVFEFYEPNFVMFKATGKSDWWTRIDDRVSSSFSMPCIIADNKIYQTQFIYQPAVDVASYHTIFTIQASGFSGISNMIKNSFNLNKQFSMKFVSLEMIKLTGQPSEFCR